MQDYRISFMHTFKVRPATVQGVSLLVVLLISAFAPPTTMAHDNLDSKEQLLPSILDLGGKCNWGFMGGGPGRTKDECDGVAIDYQGNGIVGGVFNGTADIFGEEMKSRGKGDMFFGKISPTGEVLWMKQYGGRGDDNIYDVSVDLQGNIVASGWFAKTIVIGKYRLKAVGGQDQVVFKTDPAGNVLWAKQFGGPGMDGGNEVVVDEDGFIFCSAMSDGVFRADSRELPATTKWKDGIIQKLAPEDGACIWAVRTNGRGPEQCRAIGLDAEGNILAGYEYRGEWGIEKTRYVADGIDGVLVKLSPQGKAIWTLHLTGPGMDYIRGVDCDRDNNIYVTGVVSKNGRLRGTTPEETVLRPMGKGPTDDLLMKLDPDARVLWKFQIEGTGSGKSMNDGMEISVTPEGNIFMPGGFADTLRIFAPNGRIYTCPGTTKERQLYVLGITPDGIPGWRIIPQETTKSASGGVIHCTADGSRFMFGTVFYGTFRLDGNSFRVDDNERTFAVFHYGTPPITEEPGTESY